MSWRYLIWLDDEHPFTGWHMLAVTLTFFAVIIGVNVALSIAAGGTFPGLVVSNSYVASQTYNALLNDARAQDASGVQLALTAPAGILEARLTDASAAAIRGLEVVALVTRPTSSSDDRVVRLAAAGDVYRAAAALPPGQWAVELEARLGDRLIYREVTRVILMGGGG